MPPYRQNTPGSPRGSSHGLRLVWILCLACLLITFFAALLPRPKTGPLQTSTTSSPTASANSSVQKEAPVSEGLARLNSGAASEPLKTAEEIVAAKLSRFATSRRDLAYALARRQGLQVPEAVNRFFDALQTGNWERIQASFEAINGRDSSAGAASTRPPGINELWPAIIDAYGAAEQVHEWPAQALLDYGNAVLGSLRPGMVYVGGTDNGRWIPELLNDTSDEDRHIIVTQNALADASYLDYVSQLYNGRLSLLTSDDSQRAFQDYVADAQKRLEHDQQFPDEPKQIRPGEQVSQVDGHMQVSGQVAVMQINELLLQTLMQKNPDLSFAMQESFPLKGTYADAVPLGPLMELQAPDAQNTFTAETAAQTLDYWRSAAGNILNDADAAGSDAALKSYSHDANSAANLLAAHQFMSEAEQAYRLASQLWPGNPEPVGGLSTLLAGAGRTDEAQQLLESFVQNYPDQRSAVESFWSLRVPNGH